MHISLLRDKLNEITGQLIIMNDITERKRAEKEREKMLKEIQVANEQLRKIDRSKDEFLSIVTHDLKTPLTSVLGYADAILMGVYGQVNDEQKNALGKISQQATKQQAMIDTILDYTRIEFGRVVNNLIGNSIKYTPANGHIEVSSTHNGSVARFAVKDDGMGIAKDDLGHIFEKFYMVDATLAREKKSLGLGLNIVKSFVEAHQGKVWAESEGLGKGSTFIVELPIADEASGV